MKTLSEYILEGVGEGTSDNALYYRVGKYKYNWMMKDRKEVLDKRYHINSSNRREKLIQWQKETSFPLMPDKLEIIHRKDWDLDTLNGVSEEALNHKHYDIWWKYIYDHYKPKHKILTVFECSNAKPYFSNSAMRYFLARFSKWTDWASIDYGIQPWDYVNFYPSRWDEWDHGAEDEHMAELYSEKTKKRILEFHKHFKYDKIIFICQNNHPQRPVNELWKDNTNNFRDWAVILTVDKFREGIKRANPEFSNPGLLTSRTIVNGYTHKKYKELLSSLLDNKEDKDELDKVFKMSTSELKSNGYFNPYNKEKYKKLYRNGIAIDDGSLDKEFFGDDSEDEEE